MDDTGEVSRREAADAEYEAYEFGENGPVEHGGWEQGAEGDAWTRTLFFEDADDVSLPTVKGQFTVRFAGREGIEVTDVHASIAGSDIGFRGAISSAPGP